MMFGSSARSSIGGAGADLNTRDSLVARRLLALDCAGAILLACSLFWTWTAARVEGGDAIPAIRLMLVCACALVVGRLVGLVVRPLIPSVIAIAAIALLLLSRAPVLDRSPLGGPFGYANATGAFYVQSAVAGLMAAACARSLVARALWVVTALALGLVPIAIGVKTAVALVVLLIVAGLIAFRWKGWRAAIVAAGICASLALLGSVLVGATYHSSGGTSLADRVIEASITERRVVLWGEALDLMSAHPITGIGPSRFAEVSPTARVDIDARWAHNGFLQQGAEAGVPGFVLLVGFFIWGFVRLWYVPAPDAITGLGAMALAALAIHASVDYVLDFAIVPIVAAALVGIAQASPHTKRA
jgi:O-antigen ligase